MLAMMVFQVMDLGYGRPGSITKFIVLEYIARVPYQTWEWLGYRVLARQRRRSALATRAFGRIVETRAEQDNEQWHLLILQDLAQRQGLRQSFVRHRLAPWLSLPLLPLLPRLVAVVRPPARVELPAQCRL
jgi:hypothetical protein